MRRNTLFSVVLASVVLFSNAGLAQTKIYPTNWWTGMQWNKVQLMLHEANIGQYAQAKIDYKGVQLAGVTTANSPNYLFINLLIGENAAPGKMTIQLSGNGKSKAIQYELKARRQGNGTTYAQGVNSKDFIYLIMPDRFANGDASNDVIKEYKDNTCNRKDPNLRHGGDIQGVTKNLDYLKALGVTSVWMTPVQENDMPIQQEAAGPIAGYHGYWITNHYEIDKRHGGSAAYHELVKTAHIKGMKIIQDAVYNHVGNEHFLFRDKPFDDMFNNWPNYTGANHREEVLFSPYSTAQDKKVMLEGWFVPHLPDLNLANSYMATFMIQNMLWCTEEFGVDGWRIDTYKYCDEPFVNTANTALLADFPQLTIFGEAWSKTVPGSAYFARNNMDVPFKHNLPGVTDFPLRGAMLSALNQPYGWEDGVNKLMMTLSEDFLYANPLDNCIFLDNHDVDRFLTSIGGNMQKFKMGVGLLLTLRGIPQLYYGTEVFMQNDAVNGDGKKRNDFPGGFAGDVNNYFNTKGLDGNAKEAFDYTAKLANFRKQSKALQQGQTIAFLPTDGYFAYARQHERETVLVIVNQSDAEKKLDGSLFGRLCKPYMTAEEIISGKKMDANGTYSVPANSVGVFALK